MIWSNSVDTTNPQHGEVMPASVGELRLLTVNVNGLSSRDKVAALITALRTVADHPHIVCLQELKLATAADLNNAIAAGQGPGLPYKAVQFCSLGTDASRGVGILVRDGTCVTDLPEQATLQDAEGRIVRVDFSVLGHRLSVLSAYAPNTGRAAVTPAPPRGPS